MSPLKRDSMLQVVAEEGLLPMKGEHAAGIYLQAKKSYELRPNTRVAVKTEVKVKIPVGTCGQITSLHKLALEHIDIIPEAIDQGN